MMSAASWPIKWLLASLLFALACSAANAAGHGQSVALTCNIMVSATCNNNTPATCNGSADDSGAFVQFYTYIANTWQSSNSGTVELFIPPGKTCIFNGGGASTGVVYGVKDVVVVGYGVTFSDQNGADAGWFLGTTGGICQRGIQQPDGCSARIATVSKGANCVTAQAAPGFTLAQTVGRFTVGNYMWVAGIDLQGQSSFPPNAQLFELHLIQSTNTSTGAICFSDTLAHSYKSTWPNYGAGSGSQSDVGGPGTIYALGAAWDQVADYRGITFASPNVTFGGGRQQIYRDIKFIGGGCPNQSDNHDWEMFNSSAASCTMEVDKFITNLAVTNSTVNAATIQSPSPDNMFTLNSTINQLNGTPKNFTDVGSTISVGAGNFAVGPSGFGASTSVNLTNTVANNFSVNGAFVADTKVNKMYQMSGGVIKIPVPKGVTAGAGGEAKCAANNDVCILVASSAGWVANMQINLAVSPGGGNCSADVTSGNYTINAIPDSTHIDLAGTTYASGVIAAGCTASPQQYPPPWAAIGANIVFVGAHNYVGPVCQISDETQDATFVNIILSGTGCTGGFPPSPQDATKLLQIATHPAPQFNCTNCSGSNGLASMLNGAPANAPLWSYSTEFLGTVSVGGPAMWGKLTSVTVNVSNAYNGASTPVLTLESGGSAPTVIEADGATTISWDPKINVKVTGTRTITPTSSTNVQSGDTLTCSAGPGPPNTNPGCPDAIWLLNDQLGLFYSPSTPGDIGSACTPSCPTLSTVVIQTNQNVVVSSP